MTADAHQDALAFLFGRLNYERVAMPRNAAELRLGRMRRLLRTLGDPQANFPILHVAGTKGKGSTALMIAAALTASGRKVGLYSSPHLHAIEERFWCDGRIATPKELIDLVERVRPAAEAVEAVDRGAGTRSLTFFEITTTMALLHFAQQHADVVVLEVGLGGRLDSTNAARAAVSVVTPISLDHTRQLGSTVEAIAREKAGIIKHGSQVVCGTRGAGPRAVIAEVARARRAELRALDHDFHVTYDPPTRPLDAPKTGTVNVRTWRRTWPALPLPLFGRHQAVNAANALAALDAFAERFPAFEVSPGDVARGWANLTFPARVELVERDPWLVIDGAHNVASAAALAETLITHFPHVPRTLVFGTTRDKDLAGQLGQLAPLFETIIATRYLENPRSVPPDEIAAACADLGRADIPIAQSPAEALALARSITPRAGLICVAGSLFLAAEARAIALQIASASPPMPLVAPSV